MATTRQDAWTDDEDLLLAEVVPGIFEKVEHNFLPLRKWGKIYLVHQQMWV